MRILVIEDDPDTAAYIASGLTAAGHRVETATTGDDGLRRLAQSSYDVIVVDRMLPGIDGLGVVKAMRAAADHTAVLFLTALGGLDDRVAGLDAGGDDYLAKPFAFAELAARVAALGRRNQVNLAATVLRLGDLEINLLTRTARRAGRLIDLLPREFQILEYLARNAGQLVTRTMLLEHVWEFHFDPQTTLVETHMSRLRAKVDKDFDYPLIHTVRGAGYSLHAPD
ncbi:MAG: response regulator transcription factor [Azospirillaceae bacterium]|nr:response regulator transcription factor [Azospirillaceae bacterium]